MTATETSKELRELVIELKSKKVKIKDIIRLTGLKKSTICSIVYAKSRKEQYHRVKYGVGTPLKEEVSNRLKTLYRFGYTVNEIAEELKLHPRRVRFEFEVYRKENLKRLA